MARGAKNINRALFINSGESALLAFGPSEERVLDAMTDGSTAILMQDDITELQSILEKRLLDPCVIYAWRPFHDGAPGYRCELSPCVTVGGDVIIFNARPGNGPEEIVVHGNGCVASVVYVQGSYTTFKEAARVKPVELHIDEEELPEKYRKILNRPRVNPELFQELVAFVTQEEQMP